MNPTEKTIAYLRTLTSDHQLTADEVWSLAQFLNENEVCRETWPGDLLFSMLGSAFDDSQLTPEEMALLAETISSIEAEWIARNPHEAPPAAPGSIGMVGRKPLMPVLNATIEVPSAKEGSVHQVSLREHKCTCVDWQQRESWPVGHLGRCCKHVAYAFVRTGKVLEPWLQSVLQDCFERSRGTPADADWLLLEVQDSRPLLLCVTSGEWCNVFALEEEGFEKYAFNRIQRRWSFGEAPVHAPDVERMIFATNWGS